MVKPLDTQKEFVSLQISVKNVEPNFLALKTLDGSLGKNFFKSFSFFTYNMVLTHLILMPTFIDTKAFITCANQSINWFLYDRTIRLKWVVYRSSCLVLASKHVDYCFL